MSTAFNSTGFRGGKRILFSCLAGSLLLLSGCSTVKEARKVQKGEELLPGEKTMTAAESGLRLQQAGSPKVLPMTLAELEGIALKCNPGILKARQNLEQRILDVQLARSGKLPVFGAGAGYHRSTENINRHHQDTHTDGEYKIDLKFELLIYDFGRIDAAVQMAEHQLIAAKEELRLAENSVVFGLRTAFFALKRATELDSVAKMSEKLYKEHLDQTRLRKKYGTGTTYECTKAEVDWNNSVLESITTGNNVRIALARLNAALGLAEHVEYEIGAGSMNDMKLDTDFLMTLAVKNDPVYLARKMLAMAASSLIDQKIAELYPELKLDLGAIVSNDSLGLPMLWNLAGGAMITQNIFNGGRNRIAIERAMSSLRVARSDVAAREQEVYRDLRESTLNAQRARKQLDVATLAEKQAKENMDIVNEQFNVGRASSLERTDAQVAFSHAQAMVVSARYDYQDAMAKLHFLCGSGNRKQ